MAEYVLSYTAEEINRKLGEVQSWNSLSDRPTYTTTISTYDEKTVPASDSIQSVTLEPSIGYIEGKKNKVHPNSVVDIYFDGVLFKSLCDETGTFKVGNPTPVIYMTDEVYGDLSYYNKFSKSKPPYSITIDLPPLANDTLVRATYRYPEVKFIEDYVSDIATRVDNVEAATKEIDEKLEMVLPHVDTNDDDKILQVVDGKYTVVSIADSSVATYINNYMTQALGGEY